MGKKKQKEFEYKKINIAEEFFNPSPSRNAQNLLDCALETFPDARPKALKEWYRSFKKSDLPVDPEHILFIAVMCGAHSRVVRPDIKEYLEELWKYLTQGMHKKMNHELAEILIQSLAPLIQKTVASRGHKRGWPKGEYVREKGRLPERTGAWISALLTDKYLRQLELKADKAQETALKLAAILMGREGIPDYEYYRIYKKAPKAPIPELIESLITEYHFWVKRDRMEDLLSSSGDLTDEQRKPKAHNRMLQNTITAFGCESFCSLVFFRPVWSLFQNKESPGDALLFLKCIA
jgi:hypothetical protein